MIGLAKFGVLIEGYFAVESDNASLGGEHQRVHLNQGCILFREDLIEGDKDRRHLVDQLFGKLCQAGYFFRLAQVNAGNWRNVDTGKGFGALLGKLLNLHTPLIAAQRKVGAVGSIQQDGKVKLFVDRGPGSHHDAANNVAFDVKTKNCFGSFLGILRSGSNLHPARLTATTGFDLSFHDSHSAEVNSRLKCLLRGVSNPASEHGNTVLFEHVSSLILK